MPLERWPEPFFRIFAGYAIQGERHVEISPLHFDLALAGPRSGLGGVLVAFALALFLPRGERDGGPAVPSFSGQRGGPGEPPTTSASFIEANGLSRALIPLLAPVALTGLALLAVWFWDAPPMGKRLSLWALAAVCLVFCVLGAFSIGVFYLPAALALIITAIVGTFQPPTRRRPGAATL